MDEEEEVEDGIQSDVDETREGMKKVGQKATSLVSDITTKKAQKIIDKKRTIKQAKTLGDKSGKVVGTAKKIKGEKYKAKGQADVAMGSSKVATGTGIQASGAGIKATAMGLKAVASGLNAIPYVGPAVSKAVSGIASAMSTAGGSMQKAGKNIAKSGKKQIESGMHNINRGNTLQETGNDIGEAPNAGSGLGNIPGFSSAPPKPNIKEIIKKFSTKKIKVIFIIVAVVVVIILAILTFVLMDDFEIEEGSNVEGDEGNVPYVVTSQIIDGLVIDENEAGESDFFFKDDDGNKLSIDEKLDKVLETLRNNNSASYKDMGDTDEERKEFLKVLIQAELATQYPDISNGKNRNEVKTNSGKITVSNRLSGNLKLQRKDADGKVSELSYIKESEFNKLISANDSSVLNYYTLKKATTSASSGPANYSGSNIEEIIWNFLKSKGLSDVCCAGIIGNLKCESDGLNTNVVEYDSGVGFGLAQWSDDRRIQLEQYAAYMEKEPSDLKVQLDFLWMETDPNAERKIANLQWSQSTYEQFLNAKDVDTATSIFCDHWEIPSVAHYDKRLKGAMETYSLYAGTGDSSSNNSDSSKSDDKSKKDSNSSESDTKSKDDSDSSKSDTKSKEDTNSFPTEGRTVVSSLDNFLFIGDSRYSSTASQIGSLGNNIKNVGVTSARVDEWLNVASNGGKGTVQGITVDITGSYSGISVQLGANSVVGGDVSTAVSDMKSFIEKLKELHPNTPIFVNSCMQVNPKANSSGYSWNPEQVKNSIDDFNKQLSSYCSQTDDVYYVDISNELNDADGYIKAEYTDDGLHCNGSGAQVFANNVKEAILGNTSEETKSTNNSHGNGNGSTYKLVVASSSTTNTTTVSSYEYLSSRRVSTNSGTIGTGTRFSNTPANQTIENTTSTRYTTTYIDYQEALKENTLYFDFLWAVFIESSSKDLVLNWAKLAIDGNIDITVFLDEKVTTNSSTSDGNVLVISNFDNGTSNEDIYRTINTTTTTTTTKTSKLGVTNANTWMMEYENNADNYQEYKSKSKEKYREKTDSSDDIIKLLSKSEDKIKRLKDGTYKVERMLENNDKVSYMSDIYKYFIDTVYNGSSKEFASLTDIVNISSFDLSSFIPTTSGSSGQGGIGGEESGESGDGYSSTFTVGTRTFKNYKQGRWQLGT